MTRREVGRKQREECKLSVLSHPPMLKHDSKFKSQKMEDAHLTKQAVKSQTLPLRRPVEAHTLEAPGWNLHKNLMGSSPIVSVQVEGIYRQALLDTGAQVTLLYKDLYHKYLKNIPLCKLDELEIWVIGTQKCPYDGCIPIKITFNFSWQARDI